LQVRLDGAQDQLLYGAAFACGFAFELAIERIGKIERCPHVKKTTIFMAVDQEFGGLQRKAGAD
jgi:hypothetical protein